MSLRLKFANLAIMFCVFVVSVAAQDKADVNGMIKSRSGESLVVQTDSGDATVVLTESTVTKDDRGIFGLQKENVGATVLIPGLKVDVDGTRDQQGRVVATTITVDGDDLETSQMIQAGMHPTAQQVTANVKRLEVQQQGIEANQQGVQANQQNITANKEKIEANIRQAEEHTQRFSRLDDYDVKAQKTVKFTSGSSQLSTADKAQLKALAQAANQSSGYLVEVIGYADATGSPAVNTKLSEERAKAVVTYLTQEGGVPVRRVVAPGAMGEYGPTATNETSTGRAENRRVEVKILQNKGIAARQ